MLNDEMVLFTDAQGRTMLLSIADYAAFVEAELQDANPIRDSYDREFEEYCRTRTV